MLFDRNARLRSRSDFDAVFGSGRKAVNRQLVAWIRPAPAGGVSRIGLSVGRRVGNAVRRNRVKRCLRVAFRQLRGDWPEPLEMVLIVRPAHAPASEAEARAALEHVLGVWKRRAAAGDAPRARGGGRRRRGPGAPRETAPEGPRTAPPGDEPQPGPRAPEPDAPPAAPEARSSRPAPPC